MRFRHRQSHFAVLACRGLVAMVGVVAFISLSGADMAHASPIVTSANIDVACGDVAGFINAINQEQTHPLVRINLNADQVSNCTYAFTQDYSGTGNALPAITGQVLINGGNSTLRDASGSALSGPLNFRAFEVTSPTSPTGSGGQVASNGHLVARNLSITGFSGPLLESPRDGGAILVTVGSMLTLANCTISGNSTVGNGGGIKERGLGRTIIRVRH